jgi:hypothetical protein
MRVARIGAICSLVLTLVAGLGLVLWPSAYRGVESPGGGAPERQFCEPLVEANGVSVLGVLALPVVLASVGLVAVARRRRPILVAVMVALVALCVLGFASVGLFYLPAAVALGHRGGGLATRAVPPPAADGPSAAEGNWDLQGPE